MNDEKETFIPLSKLGKVTIQPPIDALLSSQITLLNKISAEKSVHLTACRRALVVSIFINVVLLAVVLFIIGGR